MAVVRAFDGAVCAAGAEQGCENPLILRGSQRNAGMAVVVNIAVDEHGKDVPAGERGVRWSRQEVFHPECYERVGKSIWGEPAKEERPDAGSIRQRIPRPMPFRG